MNITAQISKASDGWLIMMPIIIKAKTLEEAIEKMNLTLEHGVEDWWTEVPLDSESLPNTHAVFMDYTLDPPEGTVE